MTTLIRVYVKLAHCIKIKIFKYVVVFPIKFKELLDKEDAIAELKHQADRARRKAQQDHSGSFLANEEVRLYSKLSSGGIFGRAGKFSNK